MTKIQQQQEETILYSVPTKLHSALSFYAYRHGDSPKDYQKELKTLVKYLGDAIADYGQEAYDEGFEDARIHYAGDD